MKTAPPGVQRLGDARGLRATCLFFSERYRCPSSSPQIAFLATGSIQLLSARFASTFPLLPQQILSKARLHLVPQKITAVRHRFKPLSSVLHSRQSLSPSPTSTSPSPASCPLDQQFDSTFLLGFFFSFPSLSLFLFVSSCILTSEPRAPNNQLST